MKSKAEPQIPNSLSQVDKAAQPGEPKKAGKLGLSGRFQAGIAEFLLITRLRARRQGVEPTHSADIVACGAKVVQLTCQHWFASTDDEPGLRAEHHTRL